MLDWRDRARFGAIAMDNQDKILVGLQRGDWSAARGVTGPRISPLRMS